MFNNQRNCQIFVKDVYGVMHIVELNKDELSTDYIKEKVFLKTGVPTEQQKLIMAGRELSEETYNSCITNGLLIGKEDCRVMYLVTKRPQVDFSNIEGLLNDQRIYDIVMLIESLENEDSYNLKQIEVAVRKIYNSNTNDKVENDSHIEQFEIKDKEEKETPSCLIM